MGNAACRRFKKVRYVRMPEFLDELSIARSGGELKKCLASYKKVDPLILDEWLIRPLSPQESYDLLEIVEARYQRSMIFCTQYQSEGYIDTTASISIVENDAFVPTLKIDVEAGKFKDFLGGQSVVKKKPKDVVAVMPGRLKPYFYAVLRGGTGPELVQQGVEALQVIIAIIRIPGKSSGVQSAHGRVVVLGGRQPACVLRLALRPLSSPPFLS